MKDVAGRFMLSPRLVHRIMKLGRTIADMCGSEFVQVAHLAEAMQYRSRSFFVK